MNKLTKRALLSAVMVTIVTLLAFTACNSDREEGLMEPVSTASNSQLLSELQEFNGNLPAAPDGLIGRIFYKIGKVIIADANGAAAGATVGGLLGSVAPGVGNIAGAAIGAGVVGGIASDLAKAEEFWPSLIQASESEKLHSPKRESFEASYAEAKEKIASSDFALGLSLNLDSCSTRVGILHNMILDRVYEIESKGNQIALKSDYLTVFEQQLFSSESYISTYEQVVNKITPPELTETTKCNEVMNLFFQAIEKKCTDEDAFKELVRKYVNTVQDSKELSKDEKSYLSMVFAVAAYSCEFWCENWDTYIPKAKALLSSSSI